MILGYISVPYNRIKKVKEEIKKLREKHKNTLEIKWSNLNSWNYNFYADLVAFFFNRPYIKFRAIIVDKKRYIAAKCNDDYNRFYYLMYYQLIYHLLDTSFQYNLYLDIKDDLSNYRIEELKKILNVHFGIIKKIQQVRSHEVSLLQLCDLFIGAVSYHLNDIRQASPPKLQLIDKIKRRSRTDLENTTYKKASKFNIFRIQI